MTVIGVVSYSRPSEPDGSGARCRCVAMSRAYVSPCRQSSRKTARRGCGKALTRGPCAPPARGTREDTYVIERVPRRDDTCQVPRSLGEGMVEVDASWGEVQPIELEPGVRTVGELEVIEHLRSQRPIVDTRLEHFYRDGTI